MLRYTKDIESPLDLSRTMPYTIRCAEVIVMSMNVKVRYLASHSSCKILGASLIIKPYRYIRTMLMAVVSAPNVIF
jgi:hypothetical protein